MTETNTIRQDDLEREFPLADKQSGIKGSTPSRLPAVGDCVLYTDPYGKDHDALVTIVWGQEIYPGNVPCINLVYVSGDKARQDSCGRQIERQTSVVHKSQQSAHGNYWRLPDETPNPFTMPTN